MSNKCILCGARRDGKSPISFHRFPKKRELREKWANACKLREIDLKSDTVICCKHFKSDDFDDTFWPKRRLLPSAVPCPSTSYISQNINVDLNVCEERQRFEPIHQEVEPIHQSDGSLVSKLQASIFSSTSHQEGALEITHTSTTSQIPTSSKASDQKGTLETTGSLNDPRYSGDLKVEHFSTPRKAKRNLTMVLGEVKSQRKKIKLLQKQKQRLEKSIENFKDLLQHLADAKLISDQGFTEMMEGTPEAIQHIVSRQLKFKNAKYDAEIRAFAE